MKVLYISGETVPGEVGGSVHVWEVANNLKKLGHSITLLVHKGSGQKSREIIDGIDVIRTDVRPFGKTFPIMHLIKAFSIKGFHIVMERFSPAGGFGAIISKFTGAPFILELNGPHLYELVHQGLLKEDSTFYKILKKNTEFQFRQAKVIVAPLKSLAPKKYQDKVTTLEWAVNEKLFDPTRISEKTRLGLRKKLGITEQQKVFLFHGSLRIWHGVDDLLKVALKLKDNKDIVFLIVGGGSLESEFRKLISGQKLQNVRFVGKVPYKDMPAYIVASDVGVAPYNLDHYEPLKRFGFYWSPFKIFEYMAMEKPVLIPDVERLVELTGRSNYSYKHGNLKGLKEAITEIARKDASELSDIGKKNRKLVLQRYTWKAHCENLNNLMKGLKHD